MATSALMNLRINRIILHEVFRRGDDRKIVKPKFSSDFTPLNEEGINTLKARIVSVLGDDSNSIEMIVEESDSGSTYEICNQMILADDKSFIDGSYKLAEKLAQSQGSRVIPGGIVIFVTGLVGVENYSYVGIIKAELHSGFSLLERKENLLLEYLVNLLLTPQQKLYKIALFIETSKKENAELRSPEDFKVLIYDHLMKTSQNGEAAQYFYENFLGCSFFDSPKKMTKEFYNLTKEFIDLNMPGGEEKIDQNTFLYTYLKGSQNKTILVSEYASSYLPLKYRDSYQKFMVEKKFPIRAINKDLTYLKKKLVRRNIKFTSDVKINAPSEKFGDLVKFKGKEDGRTIVSISGTIEKDE